MYRLTYKYKGNTYTLVGPKSNLKNHRERMSNSKDYSAIGSVLKGSRIITFKGYSINPN